MELTKYQFVVLQIINDNPKSSPNKIDRLFYDRRLKEGISTEKLYEVSWIEIKKELSFYGLIESNTITEKGKELLTK